MKRQDSPFSFSESSGLDIWMNLSPDRSYLAEFKIKSRGEQDRTRARETISFSKGERPDTFSIGSRSTPSCFKRARVSMAATLFGKMRPWWFFLFRRKIFSQMLQGIDPFLGEITSILFYAALPVDCKLA